MPNYVVVAPREQDDSLTRLHPDSSDGVWLAENAVDSLNDRYGCSTVALASAGLARGNRRFDMKRERKTPEYTTKWADMLTARA